jgi:hypothetical protein
MVSSVTVIKCKISVGPFVGGTERGFDFLAIRTSIRDGKDAEQTEVLPLHCRGGRLAYGVALDRDDFSSNRHPDLAHCWSMIFSENRYPLFGIML